MLSFAGILLALQTTSEYADTLRPAALPDTTGLVTAVRADQPPVLDGKDDDPAWSAAPPISGFREVRPTEAAEPLQRTEARVVYDARHLYVFVRAFDSHPDSIIRLLSRRDDQTASDQIIVMIDSYNDRRNGYEFVVNPLGVKADYAIYNDGNEDSAWDGIWDVATQIDSLGWTAEYRIPLSQLRYPSGETRTFGFLVWRSIQRYTSQVSWPLVRQSRAGFVSQFGQLSGLTDLAAPRRTEITPYMVAKSEPKANSAGGFDRRQDLEVGGDLKYAIASNLTLNATINPDFGQVEADPSVLNLSAFETYFQERRPFFVEGRGLFNFDVNCSAVNCNGEGLFYSRRIGREPQLRDSDDPNAPTATTIIGAAKVTGRFPGGFSLGVLDAVTKRASGRGDATIEPTTNYGVVRLTKDYAEGNGSVGLLFTGVNRSLDSYTRTSLHSDAYVWALDFRRRLFKNRYEIGGSLDLSRVAGSPEAIAATQRNSVHQFQRPDGDQRVDTTRTTLWGTAQEFRFGKVGGQRTNFETSYQRRSPGFEVNDLGFLLQADQQSWSNWLGLRFNHPTGLYQRANWNFNWWQYWSAGGLPTERAANTNLHAQLNSRWWIHAGGTVGQLGTTFCDRCARGGPALRQDPFLAPWAGLEGDSRKSVVPYFWLNYFRADGGRTYSLNLQPEVQLKVSTQFSTSLSASLTRRRDDAQWFGNFTDSLTNITHYTFARLDRKTLGITWRLNYTFTPNTSLQLYAQPFVSKGTYRNVRELGTPRAADYNDRFQPYADTSVTNNPGSFNFKEFRSNVVFRWEYRPGSTLFLVWSQGREQEDPTEGNRSYFGDFGRLFRARSSDTFLVKFSYWLSR